MAKRKRTINDVQIVQRNLKIEQYKYSKNMGGRKLVCAPTKNMGGNSYALPLKHGGTRVLSP
jgi:hypothetical protein